MDLLPGRTLSNEFAEEFDELFAGAAVGGLADDLAGLGVQRCVQGKRAVAVAVCARIRYSQMKRSFSPEIMDNPEVPDETMHIVHREIVRVNRYLGNIEALESLIK
jgi:hypothetical protein